MSNIHKYNLKGELVEPWEDGLYSVTTILDVRHKNSLWEWKVRVGWEEANNRMMVGQELGKRVHKALETLTQDEGILVDLEPDLLPYCGGYLRWAEKFEPKVLATEMFVASHRHNYAGTADLICEIDGEVWIVDYKTGAKSIDHGLQLAAYRQAVKEMNPKSKPPRTACLYLNSKTKRGWSWKEYKEPVGVFLAAKKLFEWQVKKEPFKKPKPEIVYMGGLIDVIEV